MPRPVQAARFAQLLRRLFNVKEALAPQLLDELFPTLDVLSRAPEAFLLRDERPFALGARGLGAAAGAAAEVWIMNKVPGLLSVIDWLIINHGAGGGPVHANLTTVGLPADNAGGQSHGEFTDTRSYQALNFGAPVPSTTIANSNSAAPWQGAMILGDDSGTGKSPMVIPVRYVLKTGWALHLINSVGAVGTNLFVTALGYERFADPPEIPPVMG